MYGGGVRILGTEFEPIRLQGKTSFKEQSAVQNRRGFGELDTRLKLDAVMQVEGRLWDSGRATRSSDG